MSEPLSPLAKALGKYVGYPPPTVDAVWNKASIAPALDSTGRYTRMDRYGSIIMRNSYGNRNDLYGWEVDHIIPVAAGGSNDLDNLQPLHWNNNCRKSDKIPVR